MKYRAKDQENLVFRHENQIFLFLQSVNFNFFTMIFISSIFSSYLYLLTYKKYQPDAFPLVFLSIFELLKFSD